MLQHLKLKYKKCDSTCSFWRIYTNSAAGSITEQHLETSFLSRAIKLLTDPAVPGVTRTHPPRTALGEALTAL